MRHHHKIPRPVRAEGASPSKRCELWAGIECTVNRVGDQYFNQLERGGHARRIEDLDLFANLGIKTMRYPVLWELTAPDGLDKADWSWADERLGRLKELGIEPVVGLVHHGSGPLHTNLLDPAFATGLAEFARAVAQRYPWLRYFTPVNEPLTTARFSALYGHWYPHARDDLSFAQALLNQCRATVLAMAAIREGIPDAQLVQTEDMGKTHSTPALQNQAHYENERRWLSFDLLCGSLKKKDRMWRHLRYCGISQEELLWFRSNPCPPDIMGINYYLTSERFLDESSHLYPLCTRGGNGAQHYADVEAVRVDAQGIDGPGLILNEAWQRYGLPLAITEAQLCCTREEQMRWLRDVWTEANAQRALGVDVRAVTAWSTLGAHDWNSLLTVYSDHYEPGAFDLRSPQPRPTAVAAMMEGLAKRGVYEHPVLNEDGWWRSEGRLIYPRATRFSPTRPGMTMKARDEARPVLITGATGTLGQAFARLCETRNLSYRLLSRSELDIANAMSVAAALREHRPWAVINTAGYVRVDDAETDAERCFRENSQGPATLAWHCADRGIRLATFSSDLVFDGTKPEHYTESDKPNPLNAYGRSKAQAETQVLKIHPSAIVVRTSAFFGPWDKYNFITIMLRELAAGHSYAAADDLTITPTYVPDLVHCCLDLLIDGERGLWHLANEGATTWAEFARKAASVAGFNIAAIEAKPAADFGWAAARPRNAVLASEHGQLMPSLENALARYFVESEEARLAPVNAWTRRVAANSLAPAGQTELLNSLAI